MRGAAVGPVIVTAVIGLVLAVGVCWICWRNKFSLGRTVTWTVMTAAIGPIAPVLMWAYFEWPGGRRSGHMTPA